jgi:hypothetical protein
LSPPGVERARSTNSAAVLMPESPLTTSSSGDVPIREIGTRSVSGEYCNFSRPNALAIEIAPGTVTMIV